MPLQLFRKKPSQDFGTPNDIIMTGIPRSGTTLACYLLNQLPDVVALHEPIPGEIQREWKNGRMVAAATKDYFAQVRRSILERGVAVSRHVGGKIPDSHVPQEHKPGELRQDPAQWGEIAIDKPLSPNFALAFKQPQAFTGALDVLVHKYPCYAIVRNPLAILGSWNSVNYPFRTGHGYASERLDARLAHDLQSIDDVEIRQIRLLRWFFDKYTNYLPPERVIRYEDIIASGGHNLQVLVPAAAGLNEPLASKNSSKTYDSSILLPLGERLLQTEGNFWRYYEREDVAQLLEEMKAQKC